MLHQLIQLSINVNNNPIISVSANNNNICIGESVTLSATGAINYLWDNGVTSSTQIVTPSTSAIINILGSWN